ncbi:DUF2283 domain-containing protein [Synechococcus sp. BDU 130192]|uniref:DUF2283 domain-containing protein n=1 Tax=Synechococcus sp. BDU 130192 TaxID=2042059 RepID=UPI000C07027C|nr:DUF2283 domain-containing protein [Synechococcus sp. BDU 130192]
MSQTIKIHFDPEADFLEVIFSDKAGYMTETDNKNIMERVDQEGNVIGFSVMNVCQLSQQQPLIAQKEAA